MRKIEDNMQLKMKETKLEVKDIKSEKKKLKMKAKLEIKKLEILDK